jgi:hypothetical protein
MKAKLVGEEFLNTGTVLHFFGREKLPIFSKGTAEKLWSSDLHKHPRSRFRAHRFPPIGALLQVNGNFLSV